MKIKQLATFSLIKRQPAEETKQKGRADNYKTRKQKKIIGAQRVWLNYHNSER